MENILLEKTTIANRHLKPVLEAVVSATGEKVAKLLKAECVIIGRSQDADIMINDQKLSKHHFMIVNNNGKYSVKDLHSTNGIIVNGKKLKKAILTGSDKIIAGNTTFKFMLTNNEYSSKTEAPKMPLAAPQAFVFDNSYKKTERSSSRNALIASIIAGLIVAGSALSFLSSEKEVKVAPIANTKIIPASTSIEFEIANANLSEEDRITVLNNYRIAELHFKNGNYELAKKAMENVASLLPDSAIATAFITACESDIDRFSKANDNLAELEAEDQKRATIDTLLKAAYAELDQNNYENAISGFQHVIEIDPNNTAAYEGIIIAEKSMQESLPIPDDTIKVVRPSRGGLYSIQMNNAFSNGDYTKAYELANRIVKMGQSKAGRRYFLQANQMQQNIMGITGNLFEHMLVEAKLLAKTGASKEAANIYQRVLVLFPYNKTAKAELTVIYKKLHEEAKLLYAKALLEETYPNISEAKSKLEMILNIAPSTDSYYRKAKSKLKKLEIEV